MTALPRGWISGPLSDFVHPRGEKVSPADFPDTPFIGMDHVEAHTTRIVGSVSSHQMKSAASRFSKDNVLYGRLRPYLNKVAQPKFDGLASGEFIVFEGDELIDPGFLRYRLHARDFVSFASHLNEGDRPRVNFDQIGDFEVGVPPTAEQRRIVEKIEALFDEIDRGVKSLHDAKRAIGLYRQSLLKSAFEGHLTADWRAKNPDKLETPDALLARIRKERETHFELALKEWERSVDEWQNGDKTGRRPAKPKRPERPEIHEADDLHELPSAWFYLSLNGLVRSIRNGIAVKPDEIGPLKIFRISAVRPMAFDLTDFRRITDPDGRMEEYRLMHGDLLFTRYNGSRDYVGVSAMYRGDGTHVYPDKLIRCQIESNIINSAYLEAATNCGESRSHIEKRIRTTAGQSGVSGTDLKTMPVPICSTAEQAEIVRILGARIEAADTVDKEIDASLTRAEALRQSILKQAFSGKLVPQDPDDEPAPALLARIRASRNEVSTTKRQKHKPRRTPAAIPS